MAIPIILYDENHERVGETYHRRAKQLVRSGRAFWLEEGHSLLLASYPEYQPLPPTKEETPTMTESAFTNNGVAPEEAEAPCPAGSNDLLMYLAKKNVAQKKSLIRHIIAYILTLPVLYAISNRALAVTATAAYPESFFGRLYEHMQPYLFVRPSGFIVNEVAFFASNDAWYQPVAVSSGFYFMHFMLGIMAAWGVWIAVRGFKIAYRHLQNKTPRPRRPDPIALEYQRLMSMSADSAAIKNCL